jgi:predicted AAA+ superfamily ATPase
MGLINREIQNGILDMLKGYPIVALTGPRQSGKSTLLKHLLPGYQYVSLEDPENQSFALVDPHGFLAQYKTHVIIDEAQRVPHLFNYLQSWVDEHNEMGQYILSGSQNFHLMESITQSLAGRVAILKLLPLDITELDTSDYLPGDWRSYVLKGSYPAIYDRDLEHTPYYANYVQTYIKRDVSSIRNIHDTSRFESFLSLCASRTGQLVNLNNLASECGISSPTAKSWLSILENSYIVYLLHPYYENFTKRIVKSPKLYFYDTGLASYLLQLRNREELENPALRGALFENLIVSEMQKRNYHRNQNNNYWFWRESHGHEIDLLMKTAKGFEVFEIKSSQTISYKLIEGMNYFDSISGGRVQNKTLIYGGDETQDRTHFRVRNWKTVE